VASKRHRLFFEFNMGFLILIAVGGVMGWLASIMATGDTGRSIGVNVAVGLIGAVAAGALASRESLLIGLSATALLAALVGSIGLLAVFNAARLARTR
jgi:uncharacterized membrane protein YeaQ/YmgE (transglycosylase-associated protein family)